MVGNTKPQNVVVEVPWTELAAITTPFGGFLSRDGRRCDVAFFYDVITMSHPNCVSLLRRKLSWKQLVAMGCCWWGADHEIGSPFKPRPMLCQTTTRAESNWDSLIRSLLPSAATCLWCQGQCRSARLFRYQGNRFLCEVRLIYFSVFELHFDGSSKQLFSVKPEARRTFC